MDEQAAGSRPLVPPRVPRALLHEEVAAPQHHVAVVQDDTAIFSTRVVVGKPSTPTPLFSNSIKNIVVNPYWNVPSSIVAKEIAPHMMANPGYLASQNMQVVNGAQILNAAAIDWADVSQSNWHYSVRQLPGGGNALGQVKFLFPNDHDVYLHDTPSKSLFSENARFHSSGCVRVEGVAELVSWLLGPNGGWDQAAVDAVFNSNERLDVNLKQGTPLHTTYVTAWANRNGTVSFRDDVYQFDAQGLVDTATA